MFKYAFENEIDAILKNRATCEKWYEMIEFIFVNDRTIYIRLSFSYSVNLVEYIWLKFATRSKI